MSTITFAETYNLIAFLEKPIASDGFEQIVDFLNANQIKYALTLQALVDRKKVIVNEASIRRDLRLDDAEGTACLPNVAMFEELARIGTHGVTTALKLILNGDSPPPTRTVEIVETPYTPTTVEVKLARKNELKARDLETLSMDNLYNNLKIYEAEVMGSSSTTQNTQNIAFVSSNNTNSTNKAVNTAHGVSAGSSKTNASNLPNVNSLSDAVIYSFFASQSNYPQLDNEDLKQIDHDNLEEMELKWQMAMLTMRARRFLQKTRRNLGECMASKHQDNRHKEAFRRTVPVEDTTSNALVTQCDGLGYDWSDQAEDGPTNFALMAYTSSSSSSSSNSDIEFNLGAYKAGLESVEARLEVYKKNEAILEDDEKILKLYVMLRDKAITELRQKFEKAKKERDDLKLTLEKFEGSSKNLSRLLDSQQSEGYHAVLPPYTGNYMPPKPDLVFAGEHVVSEFVTSLPDIAKSKVKTSETKLKNVSAIIIEDWVSDSEDEDEIETDSKQIKPSFAKVKFVKSIEHVKSLRKFVKENVVKSSACWIWRPTRNVIDHISKDSRSYMLKRFNYVDLQGRRKSDQGIFNSRCPRRMTKNKSFHTDYQEIDGGFVAFGGSPKGGEADDGFLVGYSVNSMEFKEKAFDHEYILLLFMPSNSPLSSSTQSSYDKDVDEVPGKGDESIDVKSAFLYGTIEEEVYVCQPHGFKDPHIPNKVYKIEKALDGLHQALRAWYEALSTYLLENRFRRGIIDKTLFIKKDRGDILLVHVYVDDIIFGSTKKFLCDESEQMMHKRFQMSSMRELTFFLGLQIVSTLMKPNNALIKDAEAEDVDVHLYRLMIGSLMYLTASRPDIMFVVCTCVRFLVTPKTSHLHAVKRIFIYLKGQPKLGLWYPRDSPFDLEAFSNNDFTGASLDRKSITGGYTQEKGIDYDEVFALVARIEAIRLFFAYALFMGFLMYQMDVKSAFLYGTIEEEVYVCQPFGFEDLHFPNKVYQVEKALYGLHQAPRAWYETLSTYLLENRSRRGTIDKTLFIKKDRGDILLVQVYVDDIIFRLQVKQKDDGIFISQDKYVADILKKFYFNTVKTASTLMEPHKALIKDAEAEDVDVHLHILMIGSLMYLTASMPDIMFIVCACARFQVTPKTSHLHAVKRILRCLKGQPNLGLWYPRDSPFDLEAFSNSDYAGSSLDRKSTIGGCQFLGKILISWQCKKQTIVVNSTTKVEYVVAASCYGNVLWIQNQMLDYGLNFMNTKIYINNESTICIVKNPVFHSKTKHIEIRHHFIKDSYEKKLIQVIKIHTSHNVADLLTKAFDVSKFNFLVASIGLLNL
nr:hypothetical protein [Tanacetum cinerariifolium]